MAEPIQDVAIAKEDSSRLDRADWWAFGVTTALTLLGYLLTLTPEVTLDWSGILTTGAMYGGVGPPAGYPAWTIYSWLFIHLLPASNPAWRVAVGSAFAAAVACGLVALMVSRSTRFLFGAGSRFQQLTPRDQDSIRVMSGYVAGMILGFSDALWFEAVVPDFVTFTILLFTIILFLLMRWQETGRLKLCRWAFLCFGLLLTNAQEMVVALPGIVCAVALIDRKLGRDLAIILLPVAALVTSITQYGMGKSGLIDWPLLVAFAVPLLIAIVLIIVTRQFGSQWKPALACTGFFLLGFALYLYLPIASATNPPVNWAYSRTLEGFVHLIGRGQFEHVNPASSLSVFTPELWRMITQTGREFGYLYIPFVIIPLFLLLRPDSSRHVNLTPSPPRSGGEGRGEVVLGVRGAKHWIHVREFLLATNINSTGRKWTCALILISICVGPLLAALLNFPGDRQSQELIETYFLPLRVPLAICVGMGLMIFAATVSRCDSAKSPLAEPLLNN